MRGRFLVLCAALVLAATPAPGHASRVSPMIVELAPTGRDAIARVELTNDGLNDIPYEVQMMRGEISPTGELTLTPADDQFLVFPAQAMVESNSQQVFRVQYMGESALGQSEIYYMSIRQIPVEFETGVSQVQVVVNYNVLANVVPDGASAEPVVRSARFVAGESAVVDAGADGGPADPNDTEAEEEATQEEFVSGLEVDVGNEGNRYFLAGMSKWRVSGTGVDGTPFAQEFKPEDLSQIIGVGVVGPGRNRIFRIPLATRLDESSITVEIEP